MLQATEMSQEQEPLDTPPLDTDSPTQKERTTGALAPTMAPSGQDLSSTPP